MLPLDLTEATWLVEPPVGIISEEELIGMRAQALVKHKVHVEEMRQRVDESKLKRMAEYEEKFKAVIKDYKFEPGDLVLLRNTAVENSLDKKMKPRYEGPKIVVRRNKNGSYILAEMTRFVHQQKIAQFRVVPYYARNKIDIPGGVLSVIDLDESDLDIIEAQTQEDNSREIIVGRDILGMTSL